MWDLPPPGLEPMTPALAGGFFTTEPSGKPWQLFLFSPCYLSFLMLFIFLDWKEIQPVHLKGIFIGRADVEAETPILWPPDVKNWLIGKDPDAGKDWGQEEKGTTEDEMLGWHHRLDGHEFEQTLGVGDGQGSLACCSPWGCKELDRTEWLDWTELMLFIFLAVAIFIPWLQFN